MGGLTKVERKKIHMRKFCVKALIAVDAVFNADILD
jgi:hypothetical protein